MIVKESLVLKPLAMIVFTFGLLFTCSSIAQERAKLLKVGLFEISSLLSENENTPGPYNIILQQFSGIESYYASPARVDLLFAQKKIDCLFPASTSTMPSPQNYVVSKPVNSTFAFVFSIEPYQSLQQFEGKVLAIRRGLSVGNIRTNFDADFANIASDTAMINFLHKHRADGLIGYLEDMQAAYKSMGLPMDFYNKAHPVHVSEDAFVCHKNAFTQAKITSFNRTIDALKTSGKLDNILKENQYH